MAEIIARGQITIVAVSEVDGYGIDLTQASVVIPSGETSASLTFTARFWKKVGSGSKSAYSCYSKIYFRKDSVYTLAVSTGNDIADTSRNVTLTPSTSYDAIVVLFGASSQVAYNTSGILASREISIVKHGDTGAKGDDAVFYDLVCSPGSLVFRRDALGELPSSLSVACSVKKRVGQGAVETVTPGAGSGVYLSYRKVGTSGSWQAYSGAVSVTKGQATAEQQAVTGVEFGLGPSSGSQAWKTVTVPVLIDGAPGEAGMTGKGFYSAGFWDAGTTYVCTEWECPLVRMAGTNDWYYLKEVGSSTGEDPSLASSTKWARAQNAWKVIMTEMLFADNAAFQSGVITGDWLISKHGTIGGVVVDDQNATYTEGGVEKPYFLKFSPSDPLGEDGTHFAPNYALDMKTGRCYMGDANVRGTVMAENFFHSVCFFKEGGIHSSGWYYIYQETDATVEAGLNVGDYVQLENTISGARPTTYSADLVLCWPSLQNWERPADERRVFLPHPADFEGKMVMVSGFNYGVNSGQFFVCCAAEPSGVSGFFSHGARQGNNGVEFSNRGSSCTLTTGGIAYFISVKEGGNFAYPRDAYGWVLVENSTGGDIIIDGGGSVPTSVVRSVVGKTGDVAVSDIASALTGAGYKLTDTVYSHPTGGANQTIEAANGKVLGAITVNSLGHVTSVSSKMLAATDIPNITVSKITDFPSSMPASDVSAWAKASEKPSYTFSEISNKPTTLAGYGITDAKINGGVITLGNNTITPITSLPTATSSAAGIIKVKNALYSGQSDESLVTYSAGYINSLSDDFLTKEYVISRGENLVTNGFGSLKNDYNFTSFDFDGADTQGAAGSFKKEVSDTTSGTLITDELIPVDISQSYRLNYFVKNTTNTSTYDFLDMYDIDGKRIQAGNVTLTGGTTTTLARELKNGDTVVYLTDASQWLVQAPATGGDNYRRGLIFWNYKNAGGYQYPAEYYSQNWWFGLWDDSRTAINKTNNTVTLKSAWNHGTFPAGTSVSQSGPSGSYVYGNSNYIPTQNVWTKKTAVYTPAMFRNGTAYVKIGFLHNYSKQQGNIFRVCSVCFTQQPSISDLNDMATKTWVGQQSFTKGESIHYVKSITGTAANTTSGSYNAAIWEGTCDGVTSLYTGLTVQVKVPVAGNGSYGTVLNVNNLGEHPVVANVNTMVSTRYPVGSIITLIYDADQTANVYQSGSSSSKTGCWKIADYDTTNIWQLRHAYGSYVAYAAVKRNVLFLQKNETSLLPVNSVGGTGTSKTLTTESFNPFGCILYYNSTTEVAAGANIGVAYLYQQVAMDLRYSFNTGTGLTVNKDVYLVAELQSDGLAKLASTPILQELPSESNEGEQYEGKLFIYLGHSYNNYCIELHPIHPIYWRKFGKVQRYTGINLGDMKVGTLTATSIGGASGDFDHLSVEGASVATQTWVGQQGYITSAALNGYATESLVGTYCAKFLDMSQTRDANTVLAGPASGSAAAPTFRSLVSEDLPGYGEAFLDWGGKNLSGSFSPTDAAMIGELGANRAAFLPAVCSTFEYSRNGGVSWTAYPGTTDAKKIGFFSGIASGFICGYCTSSDNTGPVVGYQLRITVDTYADTSHYLDTQLRKFVFYAEMGRCASPWCTIQIRTTTNHNNNVDTWKTISDKVDIGGSDGFRVINTSPYRMYHSSNYRDIRFIFGYDDVASTATPTCTGLRISRLFFFGGMGYKNPSNMAANGHLYAYDASQNATFPAKITATQFVKSGGTSSQVLMANGSVCTLGTGLGITNGVINVTGSVLPPATVSSLGGIMVGEGLSINSSGILSADKQLQVYNNGSLLNTVTGLDLPLVSAGASGDPYRMKIDLSGYVSKVMLGTVEYTPSNGVVTLPAYPSGGGGGSSVFAISRNGQSVTLMGSNTSTFYFEEGDGIAMSKIANSSMSGLKVGLGLTQYDSLEDLEYTLYASDARSLADYNALRRIDKTVLSGTIAEGQFYSKNDGSVISNTKMKTALYTNVSVSKTYTARGFGLPSSGYTNVAMVHYFHNSTWLGYEESLPTQGPFEQVEELALTLPSNCNRIAICTQISYSPVLVETSLGARINSQDLKDAIAANKAALAELVGSGEGKLMKVTKAGTTIYVRTALNSDEDIITSYIQTDNGNYTWGNTYLGSKNLSDSGIMSNMIHQMGDSTAPLFITDPAPWHLWMQHGYCVPTITATNSLTAADIGSTWKDQNNREYKIGSVSGNLITLLPMVRAYTLEGTVTLQNFYRTNSGALPSLVTNANMKMYEYGVTSELTYKVSGARLPSSGYTNIALVVFLNGTTVLGYDESLPNHGDYTVTDHEITIPTGCNKVIVSTHKDYNVTFAITDVYTRDWKSPTTTNSPAITKLTHVSGATHTSQITASSWSNTQLKPMMTLAARKMTADGREVTEDGVYYCDDFVISEQLNCTDPWTVQTFFPSVVQRNIGAVINETFAIHGMTCRYDTVLDMRKPYIFVAYGASQVQHFVPVEPLEGYDVYGMMPRSKRYYAPYSVNSTSRSGELAIRSETAASGLLVANKQVDRYITFFKNEDTSDMKIGCASGLSLTKGITIDSRRNDVFRVYQTGDDNILSISPANRNKAYFKVLSGTNFTHGVLPGSFIANFSTYMSYFDPMANEGQVYWYKDSGGYVVYAHYQEAYRKVAINLPKEMESLVVSVVDKTDGMTLLTDAVSGGKVYVSADGTESNYIVLKVSFTEEQFQGQYNPV